MLRGLLLSALAMTAVVPGAGAEPPETAGGEIYYACATCHGEYGEASEARQTPALGLLPSWYIAAQLRAYREGWRGGGNDDFTARKMTLFAEALASEEALEAVAEFAASLPSAAPGLAPPKGPEEDATGPDPATGLHFDSCASCHGRLGEGIGELGAPPIAGQPAWYLKRAMEAFAKGTRGSHPDDRFGGQMRIAPTPADPDELAALIAYIAGLPPQ